MIQKMKKAAWAAGVCVGVSVALGVCCGVAAVILSWLCNAASSLSQSYGWLLYCLPVLCIVTIFIYRLAKVALRFSTIDVIARQRAGVLAPPKLAPCICLGTALTLLGGGSVGKEAAALQLGAAVASGICGKVKAFKDHKDLLVMAGMAASFSALLFAPLAATSFVVELSQNRRKKLLNWRFVIVPLAALIAWGLASLFGIGRLWNPWQGAFEMPGWETLLFAVALGFLAAAVGMLFVLLLKLLRSLCVRFMPNPFISTVASAVVTICLVLLLGRDYCGTGAEIIDATLAGNAVPLAFFALKLALTALCLGFGMKGGEVMPILCAGCCLGAAFGQVLDAPSGFFAAVGMAALFSACTGCPVASLLLAVEAFGLTVVPWCAIAIAVAHLLSLRVGLYDSNSWNLEDGWHNLRKRLRAH